HVVSRRHPRDEREGGAGGAGSLVHLRGDRAVRDGRAFGLNLSAGAGSWRIDARSVAKAATDLRSLIRNQFTNLQAAERAEVVRFLATSNGASGDPADQLRESRSLHVVREMLRERLPRCELVGSKVGGLSFEAMIAFGRSCSATSSTTAKTRSYGGSTFRRRWRWCSQSALPGSWSSASPPSAKSRRILPYRSWCRSMAASTWWGTRSSSSPGVQTCAG